MNLLVDTHALIWFVAGDRRLGRAARRAMEDEAAQLHVSAVTVWEMAIKLALKHLELPKPLPRYMAERVEEGYTVIAMDWPDAAAVEHLPFHHRDPFDRLIIAQARAAHLPVVTRDKVFRKYGIEVIW